MFEKDLYDLIRGLRNHKGSEKEYIQNSLKECRAEIRGKDMDIKATALLKLVYLEMFGHDMSWASFHVLEVMSSSKYSQKRVGYLGAVQSFRPDTEVLMLATNLLKKDIFSTSTTIMSLPIITLPHIITSSLAMSVLTDLLPRLTHSIAAIRKKTIITLYRLALVYPETLRSAWPKIKERLMDENEDSSVTAAIVNVVCELGWRRPQDFLPLAPRLFELLVDSGNNWMAIKLIKLFATLTPLEPRLVKKLLPPLTSIIRTTPSMSLLYECINGIIQGGILDSADDFTGGEEIATLCVGKLRGMIMVEGDPNLKYVALLAFNKIVLSHPYLVAQQEDVIMGCLDSADMSIRLRALDLVVGMVSSDNLISIVGRLMRQLRSPSTSVESGQADTMQFLADSDDEDPEVNIKTTARKADTNLSLPDGYKSDLISRIIEICSINNYTYLLDFEWYIDVLIQLVRNAPIAKPCLPHWDNSYELGEPLRIDITERVGDELRNIAVKVKAVRESATRAAESIILASYSGTLPQVGTGNGTLRPVAWVAGEYAIYLLSPEDVLTALLQITTLTSNTEVLIISLQSVTKIFAILAGNDQTPWTNERKIVISLLMARIIRALEPLLMHPDLEVQERAVGFSELLRLTAEACEKQQSSSDAPLLLTQAIPSLFAGLELNSVARGAQLNVPIPSTLNLDEAINSQLSELLRSVDSVTTGDADQDEFEVYYHRKSPTICPTDPAISRITANPVISYQQSGEEDYLDPDILARRRTERIERNRDDPFYIAGGNTTSTVSTSLHNILSSDNGNDLDIDSIPIMQLDLGKLSSTARTTESGKAGSSKTRQRVQVAADETLSTSGASTPRQGDSETNLNIPSRSRLQRSKHSPLLVDSSNIEALSLEENGYSDAGPSLDQEHRAQEDAEMAKAMQKVEKLRLEMQRANERIQAAHGVPPEGTLVKKKAKKKLKTISSEHDKAKLKTPQNTVEMGESSELTAVVKKSRKVKAGKNIKPKPVNNIDQQRPKRGL